MNNKKDKKKVKQGNQKVEKDDQKVKVVGNTSEIATGDYLSSELGVKDLEELKQHFAEVWVDAPSNDKSGGNGKVKGKVVGRTIHSGQPKIIELQRV